MNKGEVWEPETVCEKKVDEDCTIHRIKKNPDGSITIEARINAYNIDKENDCYSGVAKIRLKKED